MIKKLTLKEKQEIKKRYETATKLFYHHKIQADKYAEISNNLAKYVEYEK